MRRSWSPRLGAISVLASRSPVRLCVGRGRGSLRPALRPRRSGKRFRQTASSSSIRCDVRVVAARAAGAFAASAVVVPPRSDSAGYGIRARNAERGGFGPFQRQRWRGSFGRIVRFCRQLCGAWHASSVYFEREARGHERAAAMVHPIKVSPRTQDREDRKRSWREHSTNTVLGSRVAHSEVQANAMKGSCVGGDIGAMAGDCGSSKVVPSDGHLTDRKSVV